MRTETSEDWKDSVIHQMRLRRLWPSGGPSGKCFQGPRADVKSQEWARITDGREGPLERRKQSPFQALPESPRSGGRLDEKRGHSGQAATEMGR